MAHAPVPPASPLGGLIQVTRLPRAGLGLPDLLTEIARTIGESLGYGRVAVDVRREEWDDFSVAAVHGGEAARQALLGRVRTTEDWEPLLDPRFLRRGAFVVPAGAVGREATGGGHAPGLEPGGGGGDHWQPGDAVFVPLRGSDGRTLGIVSVDEPLDDLRPTDAELDVLVAAAAHAAAAVEAAQEAAESARHRRALEVLLAVSSELPGESSAEAILGRVCSGIRDALGFRDVCAALVEPGSDLVVPRAAVGWSLDELAHRGELRLAELEPLLDPAYEVSGCYLVAGADAARLAPPALRPLASDRDGRGPRAWSGHLLLVPLRAAEGPLLGVVLVSAPEDRLLPPPERLQALRIVANQAAGALVAAENLEQLQFLAAHDPLTRLPNRRAFVDRLDGEVARATRYDRRFALVLCDLDGFKAVNDRYGHAAGDEALQLFAGVLQRVLRRSDDAFRIGGDEFALLLAEASEREAREVIERIRGLIAASREPRLAGLRASFGCASAPGAAGDAQELFRLADGALYEAKRTGSGVEFVG